MTSGISNELANWATVLTAVISLFALIFVGWQVLAIRVDTALARKAATSTAYSAISEGADRITAHFVADPKIQRIFWGEENADNSDEAIRAGALAEMHLDFLDSVLEQQRDLGNEMDWSTWEVYFRGVYAGSEVVRAYVAANFEFYPDYTYYHLGLIVVRERRSGRVSSCWRAFECQGGPSEGGEAGIARSASAKAILRLSQLPEAGFPWCRTWLFVKVDHSGEVDPSPAGEPQPEFAASVAPLLPFRAGPRFWRPATLVAALVRCGTHGRVDELELDALRQWVTHTMRNSEVNHVQFEFWTAGFGREAVAFNPQRPLREAVTSNYLLAGYQGVRVHALRDRSGVRRLA
jgi:hypothetical protein